MGKYLVDRRSDRNQIVILPISLQYAGLIKVQYMTSHTLTIRKLKEELFDNLDPSYCRTVKNGRIHLQKVVAENNRKTLFSSHFYEQTCSGSQYRTANRPHCTLMRSYNAHVTLASRLSALVSHYHYHLSTRDSGKKRPFLHIWGVQTASSLGLGQTLKRPCDEGTREQSAHDL